MKIGFDAKRAFHNFTGLGNYSRTLIETLATYYPSDELHLFSPKPSTSPRVQSLLDTPSVSSHFPTGFWKKIPPVWRSYGIESDIKAAKIDVFHGLSNELPLKLPPKVASVVTIHDLIFERYPAFYPRFDRFVYRQKFRRACQQADVVVAISEQTKQDIARALFSSMFRSQDMRVAEGFVHLIIIISRLTPKPMIEPLANHSSEGESELLLRRQHKILARKYSRRIKANLGSGIDSAKFSLFQVK